MSLALLIFGALLAWGVFPSGNIRIHADYDLGGPGWAYTVYAPESCEIRFTQRWVDLPPFEQWPIVEHEVGHCLTGGLYHPDCQCILRDPWLYPVLDDRARAYVAPWRIYPWTWHREVVPGVAAS